MGEFPVIVLTADALSFLCMLDQNTAVSYLFALPIAGSKPFFLPTDKAENPAPTRIIGMLASVYTAVHRAYQMILRNNSDDGDFPENMKSSRRYLKVCVDRNVNAPFPAYEVKGCARIPVSSKVSCSAVPRIFCVVVMACRTFILRTVFFSFTIFKYLVPKPPVQL